MLRDGPQIVEWREQKVDLSAHDRPDQEGLYIVLKKGIWSWKKPWYREECRQNRSRKIIKNKSGGV